MFALRSSLIYFLLERLCLQFTPCIQIYVVASKLWRCLRTLSLREELLMYNNIHHYNNNIKYKQSSKVTSQQYTHGRRWMDEFYNHVMFLSVHTVCIKKPESKKLLDQSCDIRNEPDSSEDGKLETEKENRSTSPSRSSADISDPTKPPSSDLTSASVSPGKRRHGNDRGHTCSGDHKSIHGDSLRLSPSFTLSRCSTEDSEPLVEETEWNMMWPTSFYLDTGMLGWN